MKTAKSIIVVLFVLLTAQIASAYYCPSTGRWLSRDPIGEPGFEALRTASVVSPVASPVQSQPAHWIKRDPIMELISEAKSKTTTKNLKILPNQNTVNLYMFVGNNPVIGIDNFGLDCSSAPPLSANCAACDAYGQGTYLGDSLSCFCKCAGDSPWSQKVRGCLACEFKNGTPTDEAHKKCYAANGGIPPSLAPTLFYCAIKCNIAPPAPFNPM